MKQRHYFQCQKCGCVHYIETEYNIDGEMYEQLMCMECGEVSSHLWVGNDPNDLYDLYNPNLDERFFIYN